MDWTEIQKASYVCRISRYTLHVKLHAFTASRKSQSATVLSNTDISQSNNHIERLNKGIKWYMYILHIF